MKQTRVEAMLAGMQHRILHQTARFRRVSVPHRLISVRGIEAAQQPNMEPLTGDGQLAWQVEARLQLGIADEEGRVRSRSVGARHFGRQRIRLSGNSRGKG